MPSNSPSNLDQLSHLSISILARILMLAFLLVWAFNIVHPFISPIIWGMVIAVATHPLYRMLANKLGNKDKMAATLFTLIVLSILLTPTYQLVSSVTDSISSLTEQWNSGNLEVPIPNEKVKDWPLIGEKTHALWLEASQNLQQTLAVHQDQVKQMAASFFSAITGAGFGVLQFVFSIIIAGIFLANAEACKTFSNTLFIRIAGKQGEGFTQLASSTINSVAKGVLGVAFIQALMAGMGMFFLGVPGAGILAILTLVVAIIQLPPLIILGPVCAYAFSEYSSTAATLFTVWSVLVSFSDAALKPMLLGRGLTIPMPVILLGAIGGMMLSGIIGLFVGPVILGLSYELIVAWIYFDQNKAEQDH